VFCGLEIAWELAAAPLAGYVITSLLYEAFTAAACAVRINDVEMNVRK
jgi:hypothetical protein